MGHTYELPDGWTIKQLAGPEPDTWLFVPFNPERQPILSHPAPTFAMAHNAIKQHVLLGKAVDAFHADDVPQVVPDTYGHW